MAVRRALFTSGVQYHKVQASNKGRSEKFSDFLALSVYISKTVADTAKVTISH